MPTKGKRHKRHIKAHQESVRNIPVSCSQCPPVASAAVSSVLHMSNCWPIHATVFITFSVIMSGSLNSRSLPSVLAQVHLPHLFVQVGCAHTLVWLKEIPLDCSYTPLKGHNNQCSNFLLKCQASI